MGTQDSTFYANGSSNPNDFTGVTAWSTPAGNISFDQGMLGIGVMRGLIGLIDTGTKAPVQLPPAASYTAKAGVFGGANTDTGAAGVSTSRVGVFGQAGSAKGLPDTWRGGVLGASADNPGVMGWSNKRQGVYGNSIEGTGVEGISTKGTGVSGYSARKGGTGVWGEGPTAGYGFGVSRACTDTTGTGVAGYSGAHAIFPATLGFAAAGVIGSSDQNPGVVGLSNTRAGVFGVSKTYGVIGAVTDPAGAAGYFLGDVTATGTITAPVKNAVVPFPDGSRRVLHCMESPEHWFEDFGAARLKNGRATIKLDADFAKVIRRGGYHVFLTPKGDCGGLYVRRQGGASFEVRELQGGRSSVEFCYRIVGRRKDIKAHKRFAKIDKPPMPPAQRTGRRRSSLPA